MIRPDESSAVPLTSKPGISTTPPLPQLVTIPGLPPFCEAPPQLAAGAERRIKDRAAARGRRRRMSEQ